MPKTQLHKMLTSNDPRPIFHTKEGRKFVSGAINAVRYGATCAAGLAGKLEGKIPDGIRKDITAQAHSLLESVGACEFAFILTEPTDGQDEETSKLFIDMFSSVYTKSCEAEEGLRKLCRTTVEVYTPEAMHVLH